MGKAYRAKTSHFSSNCDTYITRQRRGITGSLYRRSYRETLPLYLYHRLLVHGLDFNEVIQGYAKGSLVRGLLLATRGLS